LGISKILTYFSHYKESHRTPKRSNHSVLSQICAPLRNKTVIDGGVTKSELRELIEFHDRVIMLGHGSPNGLMSVGQFLIVKYTNNIKFYRQPVLVLEKITNANGFEWDM